MVNRCLQRVRGGLLFVMIEVNAGPLGPPVYGDDPPHHPMTWVGGFSKNG